MLRKKRAGAQPDESYYFANWAPISPPKIRGRTSNLSVDPPPDLSIKVTDRQDATVSLEALRRLGIPEVWLCHKRSYVS